MGRVKDLWIEEQERELETLQDLWITGSIKEGDLLSRLDKVCWDPQEVDDIFSLFDVERRQYEEDNAQHGVGS